jgi:5'(3')-deoxyribonucleotidase
MVEINKIFVDMDGVLADFVKGVEGPKYLNGPLTCEQDYDSKKIQFAFKGLFRDLPIMPGMARLIKEVKQTTNHWEILTASGDLARKLVVRDKLKWIKEKLGPDVIVTATIKGRDKAVFARPNHVLIDDRKDNIEAWEQAGGIGILHTDADDTINQLNKLKGR